MRVRHWSFIPALLVASAAFAEVDESPLCKSFGYPAGTAKTFFQDCYRVGSWSNPGRLFPFNAAKPSPEPLVLKRGVPLGEIRYRVPGESADLTLEDYLGRFRVTSFVVLVEDAIVFERYQYQRQPEQLMLSMSMSKSILAILVGLALEDGHFKSLGERVADVLPDFKESAFADDTLEDLLRMASGAQTTMHVRAGHQSHDNPGADNIEINVLINPHRDVRAFLRGMKVRAGPPGTIFNYSSTVTALLGLMLRERLGTSITSYLERRLWQPMGAEAPAHWIKNDMGIEGVQGHFAASARDYARLGYLMMNRGVVNGRQVIPSAWVTQMTTLRRDKPQPSSPPFYGLQVWIPAIANGRAMFMGLDGQFVMFDPIARTVIVQTAVGKGWAEGHTHLVRIRDAIAKKVNDRATPSSRPKTD